jgi:hypothetical protein
MILNGTNRDAQVAGDLPSGKPVHRQLQYRNLTGSQELLPDIPVAH